MNHRLVVLGIVASGLFFGHCHDAVADSQFRSIGFEFSGSVASTTPEDFNEVFEGIGFEPIDRAYGLSGGAFADLTPAVRLFGTVGFMRGATDKREISVTDPTGRLIANTTWSYSASSIPIAIGGGYRIVGDAVSVMFALAGEVHFVSVKGKTDASGEFEGYEESSRSTGMGITGTVGAEHRLWNMSSVGIRGGYRFAHADLSYPNAPSLGDLDMDLSGMFGAIYVTIQPWIGGSREVQ